MLRRHKQIQTNQFRKTTISVISVKTQIPSHSLSPTQGTVRYALQHIAHHAPITTTLTTFMRLFLKLPLVVVNGMRPKPSSVQK